MVVTILVTGRLYHPDQTIKNKKIKNKNLASIYICLVPKRKEWDDK